MPTSMPELKLCLALLGVVIVIEEDFKRFLAQYKVKELNLTQDGL